MSNTFERMNCIDDLAVDVERWFYLDGGGKVQFKTISPAVFKDIQRKTVTKGVDYKKVEGTPSRLEYDKINLELQAELFWDEAIISWDEFCFKHPKTKEVIYCTPETCTRENKYLLISNSKKFLTFANDCMKKLEDDILAENEELEKN